VKAYFNFSFVDQVEEQRPLYIRTCTNTCNARIILYHPV
jgi:hypothetical protein